HLRKKEKWLQGRRTAKVNPSPTQLRSERPLKVKLSPTYISKSHRESRCRSCNRKDCSERPNSYLRVGLTGCLRRATAKCPRFRLPLTLSSSGNCRRKSYSTADSKSIPAVAAPTWTL